MNIGELIEVLRTKKNHLLGLSDLADKGPGLFSNDLINGNPALYAKKFSEGDKYLEAFLLKCFVNGVTTRACCAGHSHLFSTREKSYIAFDDIANDSNKIKAMINNIYPSAGFAVEFGSVINVPFDNLTTSDTITFRFDKTKNKCFYNLMGTAFDNNNFINVLPTEIRILSSICFSNNLSITPNAIISVEQDGNYALQFFNALSYLKKDYNGEEYSNVLSNSEYEECLGFNKLLNDIGFSRSMFTWDYITNDRNNILNKLNRIYKWTNTDEINKTFNIDSIVFLTKELSTYYSDYFSVRTESYLSSDDNCLILTVFVVSKNDDKRTLVYSKTLPYDEETELKLCDAFISNFVTKSNGGSLAFEDDGLNIKFGNNHLFMNTPNLGDLYRNDDYSKIKA